MNHLKSGNRKAKSGNGFPAKARRREGAFGEMGNWWRVAGNALRVTRNPILIAAMLAAISGAAQAQVTFTENFNYTGLISSNGWTIISGTNTNPRSAGGSSLTYLNSPVSGVGNSLVLTNTGEDYSKNFSAAVTSGAVYSSFLVSLSAAQSGGDAFYVLGNSATGFFLRVAARSTNTGFVFGLGKSSTYTYETTQRAFNTTYLVTVKHAFNTASTTDDTVSIWINPTLGSTEVSNTAVLSGVGAGVTDSSSIDRVILRQGSASSAPTLTIDGILVSTNWSDVTPASGGGGTGPTITGISPTFGLAGTIVTITGTDFTGATAVRFNLS